MVTNSTGTAVSGNPFTIGPGSTTSNTPAAGSAGGSFEQQLSAAVAESLEKLGVAPGEVNITIRNGGAQASARQILISYTPATVTNPGISTGNPVETSVPKAEAAEASWAPYAGPRDTRDQIPTGGGLVTSRNMPDIKLSDAPVANQYNYSGPAARNPYFTTPSNPMREGYVAGFQNWFIQASILGGKNGPVPANKVLFTTEEGAQEALRLVQQHYPEAEISQSRWGEGGPFTASLPSYQIRYSGDKVMNAGGVLATYYNYGWGVTTASDGELLRNLQLS